MVETSAQFFISPDSFFTNYIAFEPNEEAEAAALHAYKVSGSYLTVYITRPLKDYFLSLALCIKLFEWTEIENLVHV